MASFFSPLWRRILLVSAIGLSGLPAVAQTQTTPNVVTGLDSHGGQKLLPVGSGVSGTFSVAMPGGFVGNDGSIQAITPSNPLPVNATITDTIGALSPYQLTPLGQQTLVLTSSAQALTVPSTATIADFFPEGSGGTNGNCARYRDDGTAPTATVGSPLQPGQLLLGYSVKPAGAALSSTQFILATGATCTLTINYYK